MDIAIVSRDEPVSWSLSLHSENGAHERRLGVSDKMQSLHLAKALQTILG
jgi:hypothetical protein